MKTEEKDERAQKQALSKLESIMEMVQNLTSENDDDKEDALERIYEHPLSVQVRSAWCDPGSKMDPAKFKILLCTGGPAVRIIGKLDHRDVPYQAQLEYQDWFTPWEQLDDITEEQQESLLAYCQSFYYGN